MLKLLLTTVAFALAASGKTKSPQICASAKLKLKDCQLQVGQHKVHVFQDKILLQDEFDRGMADLPLKDAEWIEVAVRDLNKRHFLEFTAWDAPQGQGEVSAKKWYVYELKGTQANKVLEKLIQRRKRVDGGRFKYDRLEKHSLSVENKKVKWTAAHEKGFLE
jgi:hypothetical protein